MRKAKKSAGPIGLDYLVYRALRQRGKGGVYQAIDLSLSPAREVLIKEGRRHGETDRDGKDGFARLKDEARVLRILHAAGLPVPEVLREFMENGNRYLVIESFKGRPLIGENRLHPPRFSWRRAARVLDQLEPLLSALHATGWVWRDCKPSHILRQGDWLHLIDFENACRIGERRISPWGSQDYQPPRYPEKLQRPPGTGEDDFALGVIAFQFMCGQFPRRPARKRASLYRGVDCPEALRQRIENLLRF